MRLKDYLLAEEDKKRKSEKLSLDDIWKYIAKHGGYTVVTTNGEYFTDCIDDVGEKYGIKCLHLPFAFDVSSRGFIEVQIPLPHIVAIKKHVY